MYAGKCLEIYDILFSGIACLDSAQLPASSNGLSECHEFTAVISISASQSSL
jgi:hypothetical protein